MNDKTNENKTPVSKCFKRDFDIVGEGGETECMTRHLLVQKTGLLINLRVQEDYKGKTKHANYVMTSDEIKGFLSFLKDE